VWAELPQPGDKRLGAIELRLCEAGAIVSRGGVYDRWDMQAKHGLIGAVRIRMGLEEHGAGRQLVRFDLTPRYSRTAMALIALFTALSIVVWADQAHAAAGLLAVAAAALGAHAVRMAGIAMGTAVRQVDGLEHSGLPARREQPKLELERT
jgi:hypothetical protein